MPSHESKSGPESGPESGLVFLPGLMCDARMWDHQLQDLAEWNPIAVPGYGDARSLADMAARALAIAPRRFALVGHSMGGRVALELYRQAADRVTRLALLDTGVHPPGPGEAAKRHALLDLGRAEGIGRLVEIWLPPMVHPARRSDPALMQPLKEMAIKGGIERYANQIAALIDRPDTAALLPTISCPTLVGVGRQDEWSPVAQHREIAAAIADAQLVVFEDCGHMAPVEAPDQVSQALRHWLERA